LFQLAPDFLGAADLADLSGSAPEGDSAVAEVAGSFASKASAGKKSPGKRLSLTCLNLFGNSIFVLTDRARNNIQARYWHRNGLCLRYK
jgi:hypothetical protein